MYINFNFSLIHSSLFSFLLSNMEAHLASQGPLMIDNLNFVPRHSADFVISRKKATYYQFYLQSQDKNLLLLLLVLENLF